MPILGDSLYGGLSTIFGNPLPRGMLHAAAISFPHPVSGQTIIAYAPPPRDFVTLLEAAGIALPPADASPISRAPNFVDTTARS